MAREIAINKHSRAAEIARHDKYQSGHFALGASVSAVMKMTGMSPTASTCLRRKQVSTPSMPGMHHVEHHFGVAAPRHSENRVYIGNLFGPARRVKILAYE
jgi:hypothetical protein